MFRNNIITKIEDKDRKVFTQRLSEAQSVAAFR